MCATESALQMSAAPPVVYVVQVSTEALADGPGA